MPSLTRQMADFVLSLRFEDIPDDAVKEAKRFLLDSVGCALAAVDNPDMAAHDGQVQGREPTFISGVELCAALDQRACDFSASAQRSQVQGCGTVLDRFVDLAGVRRQPLGHREVARQRRVV